MLIVVLIGFNSCQSAFRSIETSDFASQCVSGDLNSIQGRAQVRAAGIDSAPQSPFAHGKVVLGQTPALRSAARVQMKNANASEQTLAAIIKVDCLMQRDSAKRGLAEEIVASQRIEESLEEQVFSFTTQLDNDTLAARAEADECIVGIAWNHQYKKSAAVSLAFNDPGLSNQVHINAVNALTAYSNFYNSTYGIQAPASGLQDTLVAVIDSGVDFSHPDLSSKIQQYDLGNGLIGWGLDATTYGSSLVNYNPIDVSHEGHGTHVAGILAAAAGDGIGGIGTAPFRTRIMAVKVFQADGDTTDAVTVSNGMEFARLNDADVVNLSLQETIQGTNTDTILQYKVQQLVQSNIVVVMAMGNGTTSVPAGLVDGTNLTVVPAIYSKGLAGAIAVASVDSQTVNGQIPISTFSNWGPNYAEIAAYGAKNSQNSGNYIGIYSTLPTSLPGSTGYGYLAGTSMASPQVSAAAALAITIIRDRTGAKPSAAEVERLLLAGSRKNSNLTSYVQDGNTLDLGLLFDAIARSYPATADPAYRSTLCQ